MCPASLCSQDRSCRPFFLCLYDVFELLFPLPRASKDHGWCLRLGQFLLFARHEWCQMQNSHRPKNGKTCWNHTSHVAFLNFWKHCSRCLAQVKSTYCFPADLYVMNDFKSKTPTALGTVKHACWNHIHVSRRAFEFLQVLFPLPRASKEHILFPTDLGQFLLYVMNDVKSKNPIALGIPSWQGVLVYRLDLHSSSVIVSNSVLEIGEQDAPEKSFQTIPCVDSLWKDYQRCKTASGANTDFWRWRGFIALY